MCVLLRHTYVLLRYSTVEKVCLAIKLGIQAFRVYLLGRAFTVQTDYRALQWLDRVKESNTRLTRWSLSLQPYQFELAYRPGNQNGNADGLSRDLWQPASLLQEKGEGNVVNWTLLCLCLCSRKLCRCIPGATRQWFMCARQCGRMIVTQDYI